MVTDNSRLTAFTARSVPTNYRNHLEPYMFRPWAERLLARTGLTGGQQVLDVATGTGVVARAAARRVGPSGRVVASDVSPAMLAVVASEPGESGGAAIETLECPATALKAADGAFDRVLCQQGLPFIPDRAGAVREFHRVLRPGGRAAIAVWLAGFTLEPFDSYFEVLRAFDIAPPFPRAFDTASYTMGEAEVTEVFEAAGFADLDVHTEELELVWPDAEAAVNGLWGTPFGPAVAGLEPARRDAVLEAIGDRFASDGEVRRVTKAVFGLGAR